MGWAYAVGHAAGTVEGFVVAVLVLAWIGWTVAKNGGGPPGWQ